MASEENGEVVVDTNPKAEAATLLATQNKFDLTSAPMTEEPQVEDVATQNLNYTSHDSQIIVENVASEIEEAKEECQKEDTAVLVVSEEVLEVHKEAETLNEEGEVRVLRRRTVVSTPMTKRKYTRHNQKVYEELEKEVAKKNDVSTTEVVEELAATAAEEPEETAAIKEDVVGMEELKEEKQQLEEEQLTNEVETEKREEPGVEDTVLKGSSTELPDTAETDLTKENVVEKVTDESETKQKGEEVYTSDHLSDEIERPPVVQRRGLRGRCKVTPKPESTKQSKRHHRQEEEHTDEADVGAGGSASEEKADEKAMDTQMGEPHQVDQDKSVDEPEEISTEELTVVEEGRIPDAEEAAEDVTSSTEVSVEEHKEVREDGKPETVSVMEAQKEEEAEDVIQEPVTVTSTSGTVIPDEVLDEAALPVAEEPQEKDIGCEIPKLQQATVILVDLKTTGHHLSVKVAEEMPAEGECSTPEKEQVELIAPEEKDVFSSFAEEQTSEPEMLVLEEDDRGKQNNNTEKSADAATEAGTVEKQGLEEDTSNKEKKESANVDGGKGEAEEAPFIETSVLRSGRKIVKASHQEREEDNIGEVITKKKVDEAEIGTGESEGEMEAMETDAVTIAVPVEGKQFAVSQIRADIEADIPVVEDVEDNLSPAEVDEEISLEEEEAPVSTRAFLQEEEKKEAGDSKSVEVTGEKEEAVKGEAVEKRDKERGEKMVEEIGGRVKEEAASESQENLEPEIDAEEGRTVAEENELLPVSVTRSLRSGGKTPRAPPINRSKEDEEEREGGTSAEKSADDHKSPAEPRILRMGGKSACRNRKQKEDEGPKETAEETKVEDDKEDEAELGSAKEPPTEDERKAPEEDEIQVEKEEPVTLEVEKGVSEKGPMTITEKDENTAGISCTAIHTLSEEEAAASAEEQHSEEMVPQLSDLQRVTVVLVDLKNTHHKVREETAVVEKKSATEVEEGQRKETIAEEDVPGSPFGIEKTELEKVEVEEIGFRDQVEDAITIQDTGEEGAEDTAKEDEAKNVDDQDEVKETRTLRSKKQAVKATLRGKSAKSRQKRGEEEKEETSEIREEEPPVEFRVLRTGRMSIPDKQRCRTQTTHKQLQEEEVEEEEGGEECTAVKGREAEEEEQQAEEQKQMIEQEKGRKFEVKDATQQIENVEPEMGIEKVDTGAEEAVILSEEEQASSTETVADEDTEDPVGHSADEEKTSDDIAEEAVTTQAAAEGEQSTTIPELALLTAKDDEAKGVSEVEEASVNETRVLRSGEKTVIATAKSKTTKTDEQEEEATGEKSTEDEATAERRVLRKGRRSAATTPQRKSKRAREQCETEEEGEDETTPAEEMQAEKPNALLEDVKEKEENKDEKTEEKNEDKAGAQKGENTESEEDYEQVEEAAGDRSTEDESTVETRVLRKGRRSAAATPRRKSKRARMQCEKEEEGEDNTTPAEEIQVEVCKAYEKEDNMNEKKEEKIGEDHVAKKEENTEPEFEIKTVETVAEQSLTEQETVEEEQSSVSETCANEQKETPVGESAEEETNTDEGKVTDEEEAPVVETRVLRSHGKVVKATPRTQTTKSQQEENKQEGTTVEKCSDTDEPAVETNVLRKGKRSAPATPKYKAKRPRTQCETEEEEREETEGEEEETGQELPGEKGEKAEEEGKSMEMGVKIDKVVEEEVDSEAGGEPAVGDSEEMKDDLTEEAAVLEKEDNSMAAVDETGTDMVKVEETDSAKEKETTVPEKSTAAAEVGSHTAVAEEGPLVTDQSVVTEEEAPTVTSRSLRSKTKTSQATRSRKQKDQGVVETQQQVEENPEDEKTQEGQLTDDSPENGELSAKEQAGSDEASLVGLEAGPPAEDSAEDQTKEIADLIDDRVIEAAGEEPAGCTTRGKQLELSSAEENLENSVGAFESTSEQESILSLVLDTDEEVETAGLSQDDEEDEQNMSEEEVEPLVIGKRVLRGRTVPSRIITPQSKSRRHSAKVKSEDFMSDEKKSPESAQKRSLCKRKSTEVTPTRRSKRHSRV